MRLTVYTDFSLRVLMFLALRDDRLATIAEIAKAYGITGIPETFFISRTGKIIGRAFGDKEWDSKNMRRLIDDLLKEK